MAHIDLILPVASVEGIAEPHQSTVAAILGAARQGLFTELEAELLIDRVRTHVTTFPVSKRDGRPSMGGGFASGSQSISPDRTVW
jgi:hypothetical protein